MDLPWHKFKLVLGWDTDIQYLFFVHIQDNSFLSKTITICTIYGATIDTINQKDLMVGSSDMDGQTNR